VGWLEHDYPYYPCEQQHERQTRAKGA
jgi:hypothetical protein